METIKFGACEKHPNQPLANCPECKAEELKGLSSLLSQQVLMNLKPEDASPQDKSLMIKLTPFEIKNLMNMAAMYWANSLKNSVGKYSMEELIGFHYDMAIDILKATDPDRFVYSN